MEDKSKFQKEFNDITTPMMIYEFQIDKFKIGDAYAICKVVEDRDKVAELQLLHGILLAKAIDKLTFVVAATDQSEEFIKNTVSDGYSSPRGYSHYTFDISPADLKKHELYIKPLRLINIERGVMYE